MKKIQLSIPSPCHEDWATMKPNEKGRFCAACSKTVIDFAGMTDCQIAEFFKKPKENICGRLHPDQMNREIVLPRKRIGWLRYFFGFTWPAFMLFLKSCNLPGGETKTIQEKNKQALPPPPPVPGTIAFATRGMVITDLPLENNKPSAIKKERNKKRVSSIHAEPSVKTITPGAPVLTPEKASCIEGISNSLQGYVGGISIKGLRIKNEDAPGEEKKKDVFSVAAHKAVIYPNPVQREGLVTVDVKKPESMPQRVDLFSSTGQLIFTLQQQPDKYATVFHFILPARVNPGVYFLHLIIRGKLEQTEKLIVQ